MTWLVTGNSGTSTSNFLGTTDARPLVVKTASAERLRVSSGGDISVGNLGGTRSPNYRLDVDGVLNANDIYKGGAPLVGSQWSEVAGGISYGGVGVGIGKAPGSSYRLDVDGAINAADVHKNGAPLVSSQWSDVAGGITYAAGDVGIGGLRSGYKLNVDGILNAADVHKNGAPLVGSQWEAVAGGINYGGGSVGIGKTPGANYKLDVAGTINAADIQENGTPLVGSQWSDVTGGISYVGGSVTLLGPLAFTNATTPMMYIFQSGTANPERPIISHSPPFPGWGLSYRDNDDTMIFQSGGQPVMAMALGASTVGIGTASPQGKLDVRGDIRAGNSDIYFTRTDHNHTGIGNTAGFAAIENAADYGALMILGRAGTSRGRYVRLWDYLQINGGMDVTGALGVGTASPQVKLHALGNRIRIDNGGGHTLDLRADGAALDLESNGADLYINNNNLPVRIRNLIQGSSRELKENIVDFTLREAMEALDGLKAVSFNWRDDQEKESRLGFIAEDIPDVATTPDKKAVVPMHILAILSKVVQEQQRIIGAIRRELDLQRGGT